MVTYTITGSDASTLTLSDGTTSVIFNTLNSSIENGLLVSFTVNSDTDYKLEINDLNSNVNILTPFVIAENDEFRNNSQVAFAAIFIDKARNIIDSLGFLVTDLAPGQWVVYLKNDPYWSLFPKIPQKRNCVVCFTYNTLMKILPLVENYTIIKTKRNESVKIIRATHKNLGVIEFTENHPFIYNSQIVTFKKLTTLNPNFTNIEIITDKVCDVYNITSHKNIFNLTDDLCMIGAQNSNGHWDCSTVKNYQLTKYINNIPTYNIKKILSS